MIFKVSIARVKNGLQSESARAFIYLLIALTHVRISTQLFIPGKNWILSLAELTLFLEEKKAKFQVNSLSKEFFVVKIDGDKGFWTIESLGGFIKIGDVNARFSTEKVKEAFFERKSEVKKQISKNVASNQLIEDIVVAASEKTVFGVSVYCAEKSLRPVTRSIQRFVGSTVKHELGEQGIKSKFLGYPKDRKFPQ